MTAHQPEIQSQGLLDGAEVLIVVPALNEAAGIETCLRSLLTGDPRLRDCDVIVADGGSWDGTAAIVDGLRAEFPRLRVMENPHRLQSGGINLAVTTHADPRHKVLLRADAHAIYPPGYAMDAADRLVRLGVDSVVVPMDSRGSNCVSRAAAWIVDTPLGSGGSAHRGGTGSGEVDHGHHAAMELGLFRRLGGYDASFSHNEDAELDHRIRAAGGRIWMSGDLRLDYQMRPSLRGLARQYWNYGRGRARTVVKHKLRPRARQLAPAINLILLGVSAVLALAGLGWPAAVWPMLYLAVLIAASFWMALRHGSACGLLAGPALAAMHLPWGAGFLTGVIKETMR